MPALAQHDAEEGAGLYLDQKGALWDGRCRGAVQSPIVIRTSSRAYGRMVDDGSRFRYGTVSLAVTNTGHAFQVPVPADSGYGFAFAARMADGPAGDVIRSPFFRLAQVHFHVPAEHALSDRLEGNALTTYAMEAHLVHLNGDQPQAVLAVQIVEGPPNPFLARLIALGLPEAGHTNRGAGTLDLRDLLPAQSPIYRYVGSLTTPPCTEGIIWHVATRTITASPEQIRTFRERLGFASNRERQDYRPTGLVGPMPLAPR